MMGNSIYNQLVPQDNNQMIKKLIEFKKGFSGNPQEMIQQMLNSGRISQAQINQYTQQANQIMKQFGSLLK